MKHLAAVKRITGHLITLGIFEECSAVKIEDDRITVKIDRAQASQARGGNWRVRKRGITLHTFVKNGEKWERLAPFTQWWSTDETHGQPAKERDLEWELLHQRRSS